MPLLALLGILAGHFWSYGTALLAFVILPLVEVLAPAQGGNYTDEDKKLRGSSKYYDWLLYSHVPLLYGLIAGFLYRASFTAVESWEVVGMVLSMGVVVGTFGINVAHELGHRSNRKERIISQILLLPALYMHFYVEHNRGHHRYVSTRNDPATARYGENIYLFWLRSAATGYRSAWKIEFLRLQKQAIPIYSRQNNMIVFTIIQLIYLVIIWSVFGIVGLSYAILIGVVGFLLLESINYIEHYGLLRKEISSGQYEKVTELHSWESNHDMGRIFLYELTRHAHHHLKASVKYQLLDHLEDAPQLPTGYPGMIIMALVPPLFYRIMNPRVPAEMRALALQS